MKRWIPQVIYVLSIFPFILAVVKVVGLVSNFAFTKDTFAAEFTTYVVMFAILIGIARILEILSKE